MTQRSGTQPPADMLRDFKAACGNVNVAGPDKFPDLPAITGAYALILKITEGVSLTKPRSCKPYLPKGCYVYAGSAFGPGGIRARLARHLRRDKRVHWHVDQLTTPDGTLIWTVPLPGMNECDLASALANSRNFVVTHPGFGSSDCRRCSAHLLMWRRSV